MERNLRLYPLYQGFRSLMFWVPVFFLYFASHLPVDQVLLLDALYYLAVVVLEVPSGYFSDRAGRRVTLIIAMAAWSAGAVVFAATSSFAAFAAAQVLFAIGMAFNSGTDQSLLYDSLATLGRGDEVGDREARAQSVAYLAMGASALAGGAVAGIDLRWPYALTAIAGLGGLVVALAMREPPQLEAALAPGAQLRAAVGRLRDPVLGWVFVFAIAWIVLAHVPYEFFQPYLAFAIGYESTPLVSGALVAAMMTASAYASSRSMVLGRRIGARGVLLATIAVQTAIVAAMAAVLHPAVLALILLRSVPSALARPTMAQLIHPRVPSNIRATYLSMQSLAGRLAFSATLAASAAILGSDPLTYPSLSHLLWLLAGLGAVALVALAAVRGLRQ